MFWMEGDAEFIRDHKQVGKSELKEPLGKEEMEFKEACKRLIGIQKRSWLYCRLLNKIL